MNAVTQFDDSSLEATLSHYDIGTLVRYWPAAKGIENSNFFIRTQQGTRQREFVLTIMENPPYAGEAYIPLMYALAARGLPVAPPMETTGGYCIEALAGKPTMLQTRLPGKHVYNPTIRQLCSLARFVARLHLAMADSALHIPAYPRDEAWLAETAAQTRAALPYIDADLLGSSVTRVRSLLGRNDVQGLPRGTVHADLFRDNVLFNPYGLSGVLDFHHAAAGYWIYDLAVVANDWCTDASGRLDPERTTAMLRAYHQIRPLQEAELWFFSGFLSYAAVAFWLSRLKVAVAAPLDAPGRFKNPDEFKRIVWHHARQSFFLDPRLLSV